MRRKPSPGLTAARLASRERILAGLADREAAIRYRYLAARMADEEPLKADYQQRAVECDRLANQKLRSSR